MAVIVSKFTVEESFLDQDFAEAEIRVCKVGANEFYQPLISLRMLYFDAIIVLPVGKAL